MLEYAQTFEQFSSSVKPMDLALYAGAGLVLFVLFKDRLSPLQNLVKELLTKIKIPTFHSSSSVSVVKTANEDIFFQLVTSWKQTRDLAEKSGCKEAVRVADEMFPYLSPTICNEVGE